MRKKVLIPALVLIATLDGKNLPFEELAEPNAPAGETMFDRLDANQTGLDFVREWRPPAKWAAEISGSFTGGGVCIGDFDNDGDADVFLSRMTDGGRLYRNLGDFKFEDVTEEMGISLPRVWGAGCTWADVDGDGWLDLYLCVFDGPNRLFLNQEGKGLFEHAADLGLDFKGASLMMAFSDYDLDGDLDGYLLTNRIPPGKELHDVKFNLVRGTDGEPKIEPEVMQEYAGIIKTPTGYKQISSGQFDRLYRNDGGKFVEVGKEAGIRESEYGLSATWWDYDADGYPDLYVANDFYGADRLYRNQGDGTFKDVAPTVLPYTPWFSMGSDVSDLNNDGLFDYMASDMAGSDHYKEKMSMGNMTGKDSDSWFLNWPTPPQYMRNAVYLNTGAGRFQEVGFLTGMAATDWTWSIKFGDLDCDGREDVFVTTGMSRDWFNSDLRNEEEEIILSQGKSAGQKFWDDKTPLALKNWAFKNNGDLDFENVGEKWGLSEKSVSYGAAMGDLDGDGDLDLIVNNFGGPAAVYRNGVTTGSRIGFRLRGEEKNSRALGAVVRIESKSEPKIQMRTITASRGFMSSNEDILFFGLGDAEKVERVVIDWPSGGRQIEEGLEAGKKYLIRKPDKLPTRVPEKPKSLFRPLDLLSSAVAPEKDFDDFKRQPLLPSKHSQMGPGIAVADIDGDGAEDIYLSSPSGQLGRAYFSSLKFSGRSTKAFAVDRDSEDMAPLFFDATGDGNMDLYVVSGGAEGNPGDKIFQDRLYLNAGDGLFERALEGMIPTSNTSGSVVCAADYDRDGDLDLFVGGRIVPGSYPESPPSQLLRNEDGEKFVEIEKGDFAGRVTSALWTDVDGDGWLDLMVTQEWGPVRYYRNQKGKLVEQTKEAGLSETTGLWNSLASGDFDGDGDLDYVVGNLGHNTKYDEPALLFYGDVDGSGKKRILEAEIEHGEVFPIRGLSCSSNAMPFLKKKAPKFHDFAVATLDDLYEEGLEKTEKFEANTFASGVFINQGKAGFEFRDLPRAAQVAPVYGIAVNDFNGDGFEDLFLAQNSFAPQVETGRMSGGTGALLLGIGDGTFQSVRADQSGIVVPGDAKGVAMADLNGDHKLELIVTNNGGKTQVFEETERVKSNWLAVELDASDFLRVGARIEIQFSDGKSFVKEVLAGGSYLSQGSRAVTFSFPSKKRAVGISVRWSDGEVTERNELKRSSRNKIRISRR